MLLNLCRSFSRRPQQLTPNTVRLQQQPCMITHSSNAHCQNKYINRRNPNTLLQPYRYSFSNFYKKFNFPQLPQLPSLRKIVGHPYARLCRWHLPIGAMLLYWPTSWGVCLGSAGIANPYLLLLFLAGSWTARSAGCIVNDYLDRDYDRQVERTKTRPLASGQVSVGEAAALLFINLCCGIFVLSHMTTPIIGLTFAFVGLGGLYPLAKRYTNYPQFILGIAYNSGIIIGSLTANPSQFFPIVIPMYLSGIAWTMIYDTVYAYQDIDDDLKIGVKSTAVTWNNKNPTQIMQKFGIFMLLCHISMPFFDNDYFISALMAAGADIMLISQIRKLNLKDKEQCANFFKNNNKYGAFIFLSLLLAGLVKSYRQYCDSNAGVVKELKELKE